MKKIAIFLAFLFVSVSVASAALTSKGYVDSGLGKKQNTLVSNDTVTINSNNTLTVAPASANKAGISALGTIPVGETGTTTAKIWVE